ncbi:GNAT family N-acetyltransferase [Streptomyces sp. EAG2]|uniref:GNAT family N-acetyltransferase n=1 Tax=Streptomyces sp. EAG2 TaxID=2056495 RepID=UPI000C6E4334|nr:GNAT family N-acetyltransferase [Streptomyces sp. EAG2]PKR46034.1 histone acetyltransferase [Streptomyces sp. EAG2]
MGTDTDTDTHTRTGGPAVLLRRALPADAPALAEVWLCSFAAALPTVRRAHGDEAVRGWFAHLVTGCETWGAFDGEHAVGLLVLDGDELDQLYLAPGRCGQGLGDRLVTLAKERRPAGLALWTFQVNTPARRFYERHGFTETERTDGTRNEEREPDVRYVWTP